MMQANPMAQQQAPAKDAKPTPPPAFAKKDTPPAETLVAVNSYQQSKGRAKEVAPGHYVVSKAQPQEDEFVMVGDDLADKQASEMFAEATKKDAVKAKLAHLEELATKVKTEFQAIETKHQAND